MSPDKQLRDVSPTTKVVGKSLVSPRKRSYLADIPAISYHFLRHRVTDEGDF